jgi:hypothetical protein
LQKDPLEASYDATEKKPDEPPDNHAGEELQRRCMETIGTDPLRSIPHETLRKHHLIFGLRLFPSV